MESSRSAALPYRRRPTRVVHVGDVPVGGSSPIAVQSMTTPATTDTAATVAQIARLVEAGCAIVRVTVPTTRDADNLPAIRRELAARGIRVPLVADIHFTPAAALKAVEHVEKVRINPGNFADKKKFSVREYTDAEYGAELARIEAAFSPLVRRCKELGVAMRIGTNHGSLSDRIMNRYGDSPEGMVESALEFVRICRDHGYHALILSMKSSNPRVVLQAYRLLAERMDAEGMDYPFHLGVTEAGDGEDGRVKSALGIGALLDDGIGDTVRVSLTEDPVAEIPVALALVAPYNARLAEAAPATDVSPEPGPAAATAPGAAAARDASEDGANVGAALRPGTAAAGGRRRSVPVHVGPHEVGGEALVRVEVALRAPLADLDAVRREVDAHAGIRVPEDTRAEVLIVSASTLEEVESAARLKRSLALVAPKVALALRVPLELAVPAELLDAAHRIDVAVAAPVPEPARVALANLLEAAAASGRAVLVEVSGADVHAAARLGAAVAERASRAGTALLLAIDPLTGAMDPLTGAIDPLAAVDPHPFAPKPLVAAHRLADASPLRGVRALAAALEGAGHAVPLVLIDRPRERSADPLVGPAAALGGSLCDGLGDAVAVHTGDPEHDRRLAFTILQAARVRITRTEFISCPSCGRTLFDLETTTARIKARTAHLKGVKIAVMGCVVNGPGEMADADFGYVGWGDDRIALFVGKEMVERDVPVAEADERLVALIKRYGRWIDPVPVGSAGG